MTHPDIRAAKDALEDLSDDPRIRERAYERELELATRQKELEITANAARAEGEAKGLQDTIARLCEISNIPLSAERCAALQRADVEALRRIFDAIATERRWP